jgi:hypothetical protein
MTLITISLSSNIALLFFLVVGIILVGVSLNAKNDDDIEVIEHEDFYELPKKDSEIENDIEK